MKFAIKYVFLFIALCSPTKTSLSWCRRFRKTSDLFLLKLDIKVYNISKNKGKILHVLTRINFRHWSSILSLLFCRFVEFHQNVCILVYESSNGETLDYIENTLLSLHDCSSLHLYWRSAYWFPYWLRFSLSPTWRDNIKLLSQ